MDFFFLQMLIYLNKHRCVLMICFCALFKIKLSFILYDMLVANIYFKFGGLHYTHIWIHLVLIALLIKYQNLFESHCVWRKESRNKLFNPVHEWFSKAHAEKLYTFHLDMIQRCTVSSFQPIFYSPGN